MTLNGSLATILQQTLAKASSTLTDAVLQNDYQSLEEGHGAFF